MTNSTPKAGETFVSTKVLNLVEALKETTTGSAIYDHVRSILENFESNQLEIQQAYADILRELLGLYQKQLPLDSPLITHLRLIQIRLSPPLSSPDIQGLHKYIDILSEQLQDKKIADSDPIQQALAPLLRAFGVPGITYSESETTKPAVNTNQQPEQETAASAQERRVDVTYRQHLDDKRKRIQKIQETLAHHVSEVIKQNEEFGVLLEVEREALRQTDNISELNTLKKALISEVEKLQQGHHILTTKLDNANKYLQIIESEGQHLNEELTRVHILSLTDELTELPNRRAFMRRLEDEVARVQRYGYPLTLALIDLDGFKSINDQHGHAAGDEVLRCFASNIFSTFRHHDMVARYGGEEFAVLLPNTDLEGAERALQKVRARALKSTYHFNGSTMPMPTFSVGLSLYKPGETPGTLIERADNALYRAKRLGRNRIEISVTEGTPDASTKS